MLRGWDLTYAISLGEEAYTAKGGLRQVPALPLERRRNTASAPCAAEYTLHLDCLDLL